MIETRQELLFENPDHYTLPESKEQCDLDRQKFK